MFYFIIFLISIICSFSLNTLIFYNLSDLNLILHLYNDLGESIIYILYKSINLYNSIITTFFLKLNLNVINLLDYLSLGKYLRIRFFQEEYYQLYYTLYLLHLDYSYELYLFLKRNIFS